MEGLRLKNFMNEDKQCEKCCISFGKVAQTQISIS